jgi:hypothetical protein
MLLEWDVSQAQGMILVLVNARRLLIFFSHIDFNTLVAGNIQDFREHVNLVFDFNAYFFSSSIDL